MMTIKRTSKHFVTNCRLTCLGFVAQINGIWHSVEIYEGAVEFINYALPDAVVKELQLPVE